MHAVLLRLEFDSDTPIFQQIRNQIVLGIANGQLQPGEKLPTIRALAEDCGINMMTVSKAYQLLRQEGYISTDRRSGAVIRSREGAAGPSQETMEGLQLRISELRLAGLTLEEVLRLCEMMYQEGSACS